MDPATGLYPSSLILQTEQLVLPSITNAELESWKDRTGGKSPPHCTASVIPGPDDSREEPELS